MPRVLVVEPYEDIRLLVTATLALHGYEVVSVADGLGAVAAMERESFACLVVGSPVTIEHEGQSMLFLEHIERGLHAGCPFIVVITTYVESERVLSAAHRLDACAIFAKPFAPEELLAVVRDCVSGRRPSRRWYGIPAAYIPAGSE